MLSNFDYASNLPSLKDHHFNLSPRPEYVEPEVRVQILGGSSQTYINVRVRSGGINHPPVDWHYQ